jgi:hypothetical protein
MSADGESSFVLEFSFASERSSTLPITAVVETYMHVMGLTSIKPDLVKGMLPLWLHGFQTGDFRLQTAALGPLRSPDISFVWPFFTDWLEHFRAAKLLPRAWEGFADQVKDRRLGFRDERVPLLADVLMRTVYSRREASQHAATSDSSLRIYSYDLIPDCEASESIVKEQLARLVPGDWRTYPPFFPGDRTQVRRKGQWR